MLGPNVYTEFSVHLYIGSRIEVEDVHTYVKAVWMSYKLTCCC